MANVDQATLREELVAFSKCYDAISSIGTTKSFADIHDETTLDNIFAMEHDQADQYEGQEKEIQDIPCLKRSLMQALHTVCFSNAVSV